MTDSNANERNPELATEGETDTLSEDTSKMLPDEITEENTAAEEYGELEIDWEEDVETDESETAPEHSPETSDEEPTKPKNTLKNIFEWVEMFAVYFAVGIAVLMLFIRHCPVNGESMMHTLNHEDLLILYTFCYTPENGDIVVCQSEKYGLDRPLVKRVIATEGQTVKLDYKSWTVTVDGVALDEDYIWKREGKQMNASDYLPEEFTVPEGHVFVMGDNRNNSKDSRSSEIGFIDERYVVGKVWIRIAPNFTVFD